MNGLKRKRLMFNLIVVLLTILICFLSLSGYGKSHVYRNDNKPTIQRNVGKMPKPPGGIMSGWNLGTSPPMMQNNKNYMKSAPRNNQPLNGEYYNN